MYTFRVREQKHGTGGGLTASAVYGGTRGNALKIYVTENPLRF